MKVCTDGVKSMTGSIKGVVANFKKISNVSTNRLCYTLSSASFKRMPSDFSSVFDEVIKILNFIKSRLKNAERHNIFYYLQRYGKSPSQLIVAHICTLAELR